MLSGKSTGLGWMMAALCLGCAGSAHAQGEGTATRDSTAAAPPTYELAPIGVTADRITPETEMRRLPGQTSWVDVQPFQLEITNTAAILDQLPGLHIQNFGSIGHVATASIRGTSASQVTVYLDGIPLTRAGAGLMNLAELPFAGVHHIEVYRGFAPANLPGSSMGGAINLVSGLAPRGVATDGRISSSSRVRLGTGSLGTRRFGLSHQVQGEQWDALVVADALQSEGDFEFFNDNKTDLNPSDDVMAVRQNNWLRNQELLARVSAPVRGSRLTFTNQWVDRKEGLAGRYEYQASTARLGLSHNLTNVHLQLPDVGEARLRTGVRFFHDWRRDTFVDPHGEISLGDTHHEDVTRQYGTQVFLESRLPLLQSVTALGHLRQEVFDPGRPQAPEKEVQQTRSVAELNLGHRWSLFEGVFAFQGTVRLQQENDHFTGDLANPFSRQAARSDSRSFLEPHVGVRLRLLPGLFAEASYGEYHRTPTFMELFGETGSIAGNPDLTPEEGTNRDVGLEWTRRRGRLHWQIEGAHFSNRVDHLIVLVPQNQRIFIARNIGSAQMEGEELSWSVGFTGAQRRVLLQGNITWQRTRDLGVDRTWYADKILPGRPETQAFLRVGLGWSRFDVAWQMEHVGLNYLDRFNSASVPRRDRHGLDASMQVARLRLKGAVRNLADDRAVDVRDYPLPGRTYSFMTEIQF